MPEITPSLWFNQNLEEAMKFYTETFPDSSIDNVSYNPDEGGSGPAGTLLSGEFTLSGTKFIGINAGPEFPFSEAVSFTVPCDSQDEVDYYWNTLTAGGAESQCGWLKDRFGLSWQIVPKRLYDLLADPDPARAQAAMQAMLTMAKIVIADLEAAADAAGK
jgi:predicted 3-demethylubiquinone-9 3-methyltransferase (glyoxalase superfamily)